MINKYQILKYFDETREVNTKVNTYKPLNEDKFLWTIWRSSNVWWCITSVSGEGDVREWIGNQASQSSEGFIVPSPPWQPSCANKLTICPGPLLKT